MCKGSDVFSLTVLIDRGLDLQIRTDVNEHILTVSGEDAPRPAAGSFHTLFNVTLFSSEGS